MIKLIFLLWERARVFKFCKFFFISAGPYQTADNIFLSGKRLKEFFPEHDGPIKLVAPIINNFITVVIKIQNWQNYKQEMFKLFKWYPMEIFLIFKTLLSLLAAFFIGYLPVFFLFEYKNRNQNRLWFRSVQTDFYFLYKHLFRIFYNIQLFYPAVTV